ncbi:MAG: hypothetical protein RLO08_13870 [Parvibaculaceae bacterium]
MVIEVTREEIFAQIWQRPMTKVAADYGISDVALKKICVKHRIPVPSRGYWAKKAAGKPVRHSHFRVVSDPTIEHIVIRGSGQQDLPEDVKIARAAAKQREKLAANRVEVDPLPEALNPRVARTVSKLQRAKPDGRGLAIATGPEHFDVEVGPASIGRVAAILTTLVTAAAERGMKVVKGNRALVFQVDDEPIDLKITEHVSRTKHVPTDAELEALQQWRDRQERNAQSGRADWTPRPVPPEWDHGPSGLIRAELNVNRYIGRGLRRSFGDGKTQRLEGQINAILEAFTVWSAAIKQKRVDDERREQERREAKARQAEERRVAALEKKRIEALHRDLDRRRLRNEVLAFVADVESRLGNGEYENPDAVRAWIAWVHDYSDRLDPLHNGLPSLLQFDDFNRWELF